MECEDKYRQEGKYVQDKKKTALKKRTCTEIYICIFKKGEQYMPIILFDAMN